MAKTLWLRGPNSTACGATIDDALLISDTERPHFQKLTWVGHSGYTSPGLGWGAGILHGPMQIGIPLSGSSWEDVKLIRGTTCVLAGRLPPGSGPPFFRLWVLVCVALCKLGTHHAISRFGSRAIGDCCHFGPYSLLAHCGSSHRALSCCSFGN